MQITIAARNMSRDMTKSTMWLCAKRRLRSAWASAQSDQSFRCPHEESFRPWLPIEHTAKTGQTGWMSRLIWVFAGRTVILLVLSWGGSYGVYFSVKNNLNQFIKMCYDFVFDRTVCSQYKYILTYTVNCRLTREETPLYRTSKSTRCYPLQSAFAIRIHNKIILFHENIVNF